MTGPARGSCRGLCRGLSSSFNLDTGPGSSVRGRDDVWSSAMDLEELGPGLVELGEGLGLVGDGFVNGVETGNP